MLTHNLKIFIEVANKGSATEVANELYISQPAISKAIRGLEEQLNVKLFHRDKRSGLILTDVGHKILLLAQQMLDLENHIYQTAYQENNFIGGKLKVASFPIATSMILSKALRQFRQKFPLVSVELFDCDPKTVLKLVDEHTVDFGISASPFGALEHEALLTDRMVGIYPPDGPSYEKIDLYGDTSNLIFCDAGRKTSTEIINGSKPIRFSDSLIVQNHETVVHMVQQGNGVGVIAEFTLNSIPNDLPRCPVYPPIEMEIALAAPSFQDLTPVAAEFIRVIKSVF